VVASAHVLFAAIGVSATAITVMLAIFNFKNEFSYKGESYSRSNY
jgi:hypothetical protein